MTRAEKASTIMRAGSHELRIQLLELLEPEDEKLSPVMMHRQLEEAFGEGAAPLGVVSYHVRVLVDLGMLKRSGRKQRRGATEHFYRLSAFGRETVRALSVIV